uniref:Uncharacterized protein n=1 Tax=Rhizophora mucronata TaxID=61149 RepID=A0A2P2MD28_RHIMU
MFLGPKGTHLALNLAVYCTPYTPPRSLENEAK